MSKRAVGRQCQSAVDLHGVPWLNAKKYGPAGNALRSVRCKRTAQIGFIFCKKCNDSVRKHNCVVPKR